MRVNDNGHDREMTESEKIAHENWSRIALQERAAMEKQIEDHKKARESAIAKLASLGLTEAEIAALVGA